MTTRFKNWSQAQLAVHEVFGHHLMAATVDKANGHGDTLSWIWRDNESGGARVCGQRFTRRDAPLDEWLIAAAGPLASFAIHLVVRKMEPQAGGRSLHAAAAELPDLSPQLWQQILKSALSISTGVCVSQKDHDQINARDWTIEDCEPLKQIWRAGCHAATKATLINEMTDAWAQNKWFWVWGSDTLDADLQIHTDFATVQKSCTGERAPVLKKTEQWILQLYDDHLKKAA